jgi:dTDP-glucose pyrophosphorylase
LSITEFAQGFLCLPTVPIRDAMRKMDAGGAAILLIAEADNKLLGVLTDGDIRRAILDGGELEGPVSGFMNPDPVSHVGVISKAEALHLVNTSRSHLVNHLPILDEDGQIVDLLLRHTLSEQPPLAVDALIMAGGLGQRLRPLTDVMPKPMLPVGGRPLMELIIERLRNAGIQRIALTTHYMPELIVNHFGDGASFGVDITYINEAEPLGTAGALGLLGPTTNSLLVVNGDVLTAVDYRALVAFHREQGADFTLAVHQHEFHVPYGVVETQDIVVTRLTEKPIYRYLVTAGIYLIEPKLLSLVPAGQPYDMPDLIGRSIGAGHRVLSFPVHEYWMDIGAPDDYQQAQLDVSAGELSLGNRSRKGDNTPPPR